MIATPVALLLLLPLQAPTSSDAGAPALAIEQPARPAAPSSEVYLDEALQATVIRVDSPTGLRDIDWSTFVVETDGLDVTRWFTSQLSSPLTTVTFNPQMTTLTVTLSGTAVPAGPALAIRFCLVGGPCTPVKQLLRSGSGYPDPQYTTGQVNLPIYETTPSHWELTAVPFMRSQATTVTRLRAVVNDAFDGDMVGDWGNFVWTLNVFVADAQFPTALDAFDADARSGNLVSNSPVLVSSVDWNGDHLTSFEFADFTIPPATEVWLSIRAERQGGPTSVPAVRHTVIGLPTDYYKSDSSPTLAYTALGVTPGAASFDIYGY